MSGRFHLSPKWFYIPIASKLGIDESTRPETYSMLEIVISFDSGYGK